MPTNTSARTKTAAERTRDMLSPTDMLKTVGSKLSLTALSVLLCGPVAGADTDETTALKTVVNNKRFILVSPAESWLYPSGFIVSTNGASIFVDLPKNIHKPQTDTASADFPAQTNTRKFGVSLILSGLTKLFGGNPGASLTRQTKSTFAELKASGSRIHLDQAQTLLDEHVDLQRKIKQWMDQNGSTVLMVEGAFLTNNISLEGTSSWTGSLSFNNGSSNDDLCGGTSGNNSGAKGSTGTLTRGSGAGSGSSDASGASSNTPASATGAASVNSRSGTNTGRGASGTDGASGSKASQSGDGASNSSSPGGRMAFCTNSDKSLTMKADSPLVFAVTAFPIQKSDGKLVVVPSHALTPEGTVSSTSDPKIPNIAPSIPNSWAHKIWEEM